jgi:hypothetical protein
MSASADLTVEQYARWCKERGLPELRQVLFWRWDPIGVESHFPATADEYDGYARVLLSRLRKGADADEVAAFLQGEERNAMGVPSADAEHLRQLGERILRWHEKSITCWRRDLDVGGG